MRFQSATGRLLMSIQLVGVLGAGVMGRGVAQALAQTRHQVILIDSSPEVLIRAEQEIQKSLRFQGFYQKSTETEKPDEVLKRINLSTDYNLLKEVDFVVENVTEKW